MPDGVLQWLDPSTGVAAVVRDTHRYRAELREIEPAARHAGARIHFDIERRDGVEHAVRVTLREGRRVSPHQHRFGTLQGARRADSKGPAPFARPHPEIGIGLQSRPLDVAAAWAEALARPDLDGALLLYAPDAVVHTETGPVTGRRHLQAHLEAFATDQPTAAPAVRGDGADGDRDLVVVRWRAGDRETSVRCRIEHGQIAEQWFDAAPSRPRGTDVAGEDAADLAPTDLVTSGAVDDDLVALARAKVERLLELVDERVLLIRVKLAVPGEDARRHDAEAELVLDINGEVLRAGAAAAELRDAIDRVAHVMREQLQRRSARRVGARRRGHGTAGPTPTDVADAADAPPAVVVRRSLAAGELTAEEAAFDLGQSGDDFLLFRELGTGADAVIERVDDLTLRLTRATAGSSGAGGTTASGLAIEAAEATAMTVDAAVALLSLGDRTRVVFVDAESGRAQVLHRRDDGRYGLVGPS